MPDAATDPVAATIAVLANSETVRAGQLLEAALDIPRPSIQVAAADVMLQKSSAQGRLAVFRRLEKLPPAVAMSIHRLGPSLNTTFRQLLLQGSSETREIALKTIRISRQYQQAGNVIELINFRSADATELAVDTLRSLVSDLYDQWHMPGTGGSELSVDNSRNTILADLQRALAQWETQSHPGELIEAILILGEPNHPAVKQVLWHGSDVCRDLAAQRILESRHPGVIRLAAESLLESYPHPKVFVAIRTRHDPEFLTGLLTVISKRKGSRQLEQLRQVQQLDWLTVPFDVLESIPPSLQAAFVAFVNATRISRDLKAGVQEWMLRHGTPEGKRAATSGLSLVEEDVIHEVVRESLDSEDADVQAWATTQVRQHAIPEAFAILIERLTSPLSEVQEAARSELSGFSVPRVLALSDELTLDEAHRAGILLMKVDLDAAAKIRRCLAHPVRQKRIKAARQVARLGLQAHFTSALATMTEDTDAYARRVAAQVLATIPQLEAYRALLAMQNDSHPRVRETVAEALEFWNRNSIQQASDDEMLMHLNETIAEEW